jgi:hypothetical protein
MKMFIPQRVVIYAKDIENITGMKDRSARRLLYKIRKLSGKTNQELVTIDDFCKVTGIPEELVRPFLIC